MHFSAAAPAKSPLASWYLDPLVAAQKARIHRELVQRWGGPGLNGAVLKTDLFEEANGDDHILTAIGARSCLTTGVDWAADTVHRAMERFGGRRVTGSIMDLRRCGFADGSLDLIVSNSTLDHFEMRGDLWRALAELARVLKPGGRLIVTLDNPWNPLYPPLKWLTRRKGPFHLGETASRPRLERELVALGLEIVDRDYLVHNPRLVSTALFLMLRRMLGRLADGPVRLMLDGFAALGYLPTRPLTASFVALCAQKPGRARIAKD